MIAEIVLVIIMLCLMGVIVYFALTIELPTFDTLLGRVVTETTKQVADVVASPILGRRKLYAKNNTPLPTWPLCIHWHGESNEFFARGCPIGDPPASGQFAYEEDTQQIRYYGGENKCLAPDNGKIIRPVDCNANDSNQKFKVRAGEITHLDTQLCLNLWGGHIIPHDKRLGLYQCGSGSNQDIWFQTTE